ncbi:MAG: sulfite exporter TauE/SafE family protein [Propionibacteriaceae bacterium]|nr:sulfite exporter TauE/SafE family protein [Propionibacteriaceae bacterium]
MSAEAVKRTWQTWVLFAAIGLGAGFFSGLFGVGGGTIIVPLLIAVAHFDVRKAAGTSLAAIVPTAVVGVSSYGVRNDVDWLAALLIVVGSVAGAQIGSLLLHRLPRQAVRLAFIGFLIAVIASLFLVIPARSSQLSIDFWLGLGLVTLGLVTGILSGMLGIGGGIVVVPVLIVVFGASDLIAKGTSLAMMVPTALSGTIGNLRRGNLDLPAAGVIGLAAAGTASFGVVAAAWVDPFVGNVLFAVFLSYLVITMSRATVKGLRANAQDAGK